MSPPKVLGLLDLRSQAPLLVGLPSEVRLAPPPAGTAAVLLPSAARLVVAAVEPGAVLPDTAAVEPEVAPPSAARLVPAVAKTEAALPEAMPLQEVFPHESRRAPN